MSRRHISQISIPQLFHYSTIASRAHSGCAGKENDPIIDLNIKQRAATAGVGRGGGHTADGGGGNGHNYVAGHKWRVLFIAIVCPSWLLILAKCHE